MAGVGAAGGQIGSITASGARQAEGALRSLGTTAKEVFTIFTGFAIGSLFIQGIEHIKAFATETAKLGLEAKVQEDAFDRLSKSVGVAGDALVAQMQKASGGILNTSDVMIAAAKALNQSLQPEQIVNLMTIARQQSKLAGIDVSEAFNQITQAIANQQPRALKQLGIVVDMDAAFKKHAATLGVEVERLNELGKTQAIYNAVAEQTKNSVKALTDEGLTQSEMVQKLAGEWKQFREDVGKVVVDAGFAVLKWLQDVKTALGDMTPLLEQVGKVWAATWATATVNFGAFKTDVSGLKDLIKDVGLAFAQVGFGISTVFMVTAGAAAGIGSLLDDLGHKQIPDIGKAMEKAVEVQKAAFASWTDSRKALQDLASGLTDTKTKTVEAAAATEMGANRLADVSNQIKPLIPDLKALQAAVAGIAQAFKALSDEAARGVLPEDEFTKLNAPLDAFRDKMREQLATLGLNKAAIQQLDATLAGLQTRLVSQVAANRAVLEESKADLDTLKDKWESGAQAIEAMEFSYEKWLASLNANGALDEAQEFYKNLAENITAGAQAFESIQTPIDDAARATQTFRESLAGIQREAALVGRDFDRATADLGAFKSRILELQAIKNPTGEILTEIDQLKAKFADTREFIAFRTTFQDVFSSFGSAFSTSVKGVVMGTQTIDQAFKNLGQSILLTLLDTVINKGLKVLTDALWDFVAGMFSGGSGGGGIIGAILTGAGALAAKLFSSSSSPATVATGTEFDAVTTSASGAAGALDKVIPAVSNFSAAVSAGLSAIGVGLGIFGLAKGGSAGSMALSAGGTALSLYSLAQSVSVLAKSAGLISTALPTIGEALASGLAALFPELAASIASSLVNILPTAITTALNAGTAVAATAPGAVSAAGSAVSSILASITPFLEVLSGLAAPLAIAGAFLSMGLAGMAADAEDAAKEFKVQFDSVQNAMNEATKAGVIFADLGHQLDASHLVGTLHTLHDAIRDLGNLDLATGLNQILGDEGAASITAAIPAMRASVGAAWIAALDAAFKQGIFPTPGAANAPNSLGETLQAPNRLGRQGELLTTQDLLGAVSVPGPDATAAAISVLSHILEITSEQAAAFIPMWADWVRGDGGAPAMGARIGDAFWNSFMSPEHMAQLQASGIITATNEGSPNSNRLDVDAINKLLDQERLTTTIRNAVVDIGAMFGISKGQMGAVGAGEGNWRGTPGAGDMPAVSSIMAVQAALDAAGFVPGHYAEALEAYLVSIDQNIVNNPLWKKFTDALHGTGSADDIQAAMNAAIIATMTPLKFYGAAKKITDTLTADIKAAMDQQAAMVTAGEDQGKIDAVGKLIDAMKAGIQAYAGLVSLFTSLPGEMAAITGDLEAQTDAAIAAWQVAVQALGDNVQAAQKAFDEALTGGNIVAIQQTAQQLHDTTMAGYQMMLKAVEQIHTAIKGILDQAAGLVDMQTALAQHDITSHGSFAGITRLLGGLQDVAEHGATAAEQMWAVDQALKAIIAVLPTAIAKFGNLDKAAWLASGPQTAGQLRAAGPSQITGSVATAAAPFLAVQQAAINAATGGNKLALLQQQAAAWNNLANAAIAGVNQWAQQAITGAQEAAAAVIEGLTAEKDAKLAAIDGQIASIQKAADAEQAMRAEQMAGLQEAIAKAEEFAAAIKQMGEFIQGLKVGPLGPGNPADKLAIAQDGFAKALRAYNANPTAQGLSGLQGLAQTMLSLAEPIFSKPSPQFQALAATTIKQLTAAQAMAEAIASDAEVLRSQLALLQALDKTATQAAKDQIDALNLQKQSITDDFEAQTKAINAVLKTQIEAIEQAAKDEIDGIQNALAVELQKNFDEQVPLLKAQYDAATAQLAAIGDTKIWQDAALGILQGIYDKLATAIPAESGMDRVTEGLYHLHDGEMVLPKRMADQVRSAAEGAGMSFVPATGNNDWTSPYSQPRDLSKEGAAWGGPRAADLNRLELTIRQMQANFEAQLAHNESRLNGKIHRNFSAEALAGMQGTLAAQIAAIRAQQQTIIATVPKTPPPGTPGTTPPPTPPYVPPGPGWLSRTDGAQQSGTQTIVFQITGSKEDAEAIKETIKQVLPAVLADAKNGKLGSVIDARAKSVR